MSRNVQIAIVLSALVLTAAALRVAVGAAPVAGAAQVYAAVKMGPHPAAWGVQLALAAN
jgi:hypothetical protein